MRARRCHGVEEQQQRGVTEAGVEAEAETEVTVSAEPQVLLL